jgi:hypothetical protein
LTIDIYRREEYSRDIFSRIFIVNKKEVRDEKTTFDFAFGSDSLLDVRLPGQGSDGRA